jgi:D-3-phosphoglycerate dehydrogenase
MINKCICVTSKTFSNNEKLVAKLKDNFEHVILNKKHEFTSEELVLFAKDADGIILGKEKIDHLLLSQLPNLRIISNYGVGIDNVDIESCRKHNVKFLYQR